MENLTIEKQEIIAKIMGLIDGGASFYDLALELAFSQNVNEEVSKMLWKKGDLKYLKIETLFMKREMFLSQLSRVLNKTPLCTSFFKNTKKIDSRLILVKKVVCLECLPF